MTVHSRPISEQLVRSFEPKQDWLEFNSYWHGVDHMARVFILQELLCDQLEAQGTTVNRSAVRFAAMVHDVGRINDDYDPDHGRHSAAWMTKHLANKLSPEDLDTATYAVHWHASSDKKAPVMTIELQVLKDADGLDRARFADIDTSYLRTKSALGLVEVAVELCALTSTTTEQPASFEEAIAAAQKMGLVSQETHGVY